MHRLIAATLLVLHLLLMMLVAVTSRGMIAAGILACYLCLLFIYFRTRAFFSFVLIGLALYCAALLVAYGALIIGSIQIERSGNIWFHSFVFLPGVYGAAVYLLYLLSDRQKRRVST
jgi:hypothetical protein